MSGQRPRFVADFIGESNVLEGRVTGVKEGVLSVETLPGASGAGARALGWVTRCAWPSGPSTSVFPGNRWMGFPCLQR